MNKELIDARLSELNKMEEQMKQTIISAQANLNAVEGEKQDCAYWFQKITEEAAPVVEASDA